MPEKQIKYVAIDPEGKIKGPMGDTREFVEEAMVIGYKRTTYPVCPWDDKSILAVIKKKGYAVRKAEITLLEED